MKKFDAIKIIEERSRPFPLVTSLGTTSRFFLYASGNSTPSRNHFPVLSSMGSTLSVAIGVAIGQPNKKVRVVMGDGEFLMGINALYTLAALKLPNLTLIILNNKKYDQDGGLPTHWEKLSLKRVIVGAGLTYEKAATPKKLTAILEGPMAAQVIEVGVTGAGFKEKAETRPRIDPLAAKKNFQEYVQA